MASWRWQRGAARSLILRKAFADRIPEEILKRKKLGFPVPLKRLFAGELGALTSDVFQSRAVRKAGFSTGSGSRAS